MRKQKREEEGCGGGAGRGGEMPLLYSIVARGTTVLAEFRYPVTPVPLELGRAIMPLTGHPAIACLARPALASLPLSCLTSGPPGLELQHQTSTICLPVVLAVRSQVHRCWGL